MNSDFFKISAQIFRANQPIELTVESRYPHQKISEFAKIGKLRMAWIVGCGTMPDNIRYHHRTFKYQDVQQSENNPDVVKISFPPIAEGDLYFRLECVVDGTPKTIGEFEIYALNDDLFELTPLKGDMHVHSSFSECGKRTDDPLFVAMTAREKGLDFIALTDHIQIEGSETLKDFNEKFKTAFRVYPGEECHVLEEKLESRFCRNIFYNNVHIVSFGAKDGVCRYANDHYDEFYADICERAEKIDNSYTLEMRRIMAGSDWIFDKIHEFGGIAIFCHPAWKPRHRDNLSYVVRDYIASQNKYDVMETVGLGFYAGYPDAENFQIQNNLALAWWFEQSIKRGAMIPLVGDTDSHNAAEVLGSHFTVVFVKNNEFENIAHALKNSFAAAVIKSCGAGRADQVYGSYRLVRYTHFLLKNYFVEHDDLCAAEGKAMKAAVRNEKVFENNILSDIESLRNRIFNH